MRRVLLAWAMSVGASVAQAQVGPSPSESAAYTGLHAAAWRGDAAAIEKAAAGAKPALDARDGNGRTPLHVATFARQGAAVRALTRAGATRPRSEP